MALLPSSSSSTHEFNYDVFLSCGTEDTLEFTGLLYKALCNRGIRTFTDCEVADKITPALEEAIQRSRTAVIVISNNYASSSFCLDKLSMILDHFKAKVHPVFYHVDPSDVRMLRGTYRAAMALYKKRLKGNMGRLKKWKLALQQVSNLSGSHFGYGNEYDYELFIRKIVKKVFKMIVYIPLRVAEYPVGLESRVQKVIQLLDVASGGGVHMVGIYGVPGIGKTVLARAVHNLIADQFEVVCFLHCLTGKSNERRLVQLQEILLDQMVGEGEDGVKVTCLSEGISEIRRRLCRKKVLLILDDVDELEQLQAVAGGPDWFSSGSRVISTTRDKHLLASHGIERIYEVNGLNEKEALDLLTWSAFKNNKVDSSYKDVLNRTLTIASGFPLSLIVRGSCLYGKSVVEWESSLISYERNLDVLDLLLKQSFDCLETAEQRVFLDIACCFKGYQLVEVQHILCAHYSYCVTDYISALAGKNLIDISSSGEVTIHDLLEDMGKKIVQLESPKEPGKRSRLWIPEDILHVLEDCTGTDKIETIYQDFSSTKEEKIDWDGTAFENMKKLKTLIIKNAHFSQAPRHLPCSLRVLEWQKYPSEYLPPNFNPENLAVCKLPKHCFVSPELGGLLNKKPVNLDDLSFDNCDHLTEMLYVSCLPHSEEMTVMVSD